MLSKFETEYDKLSLLRLRKKYIDIIDIRIIF